MATIDVEEDLTKDNTRTFCGVEKLGSVLRIFEDEDIRLTLFVTGDVLERYQDLVKKWSENHEIACHGYTHVHLNKMSLESRNNEIKQFIRLYEKTLQSVPNGFRAVEHVIDQEQFSILEKNKFLYDSSVVSDYFPLIMYKGYKGKAPLFPYHPNRTNYLKRGDMAITEVPVTTLAFGIPLYGTWIRYFGVNLYRLLFSLKRGGLVSLAFHSWDCIKHKGLYPLNSGEKFVQQLNKIIKILKKQDYQFKTGEEIAKWAR